MFNICFFKENIGKGKYTNKIISKQSIGPGNNNLKKVKSIQEANNHPFYLNKSCLDLYRRKRIITLIQNNSRSC